MAAQTIKFEARTIEDHTHLISHFAETKAKNFISNRKLAEIEARLEAIPHVDAALSDATHTELYGKLVESMRAYGEFVELRHLCRHVQASASTAEVEEVGGIVKGAAEPTTTRASTPDTEASTIVSSSEKTDQERVHVTAKKETVGDTKEQAKEESKDQEEESNEAEEVFSTDFADRTNTRGTIPKRDSEQRAFIWSEMELNTGVMTETKGLAKNGRLFESRTDISPIPFEVRVKESSVRPVLTIRIDSTKDIDRAQTLLESNVSDQFLTQPAMPVMVTLKFAKLSEVPEFENLQDASVNVELGPATIAQIVKTIFLLFKLQAKYWDDSEQTSTWKAMSVPKKQLKGSDKEVMMLMRSNPVFVRAVPQN